MEREMLCLHVIDAVSRRNVQWFAGAKELVIKLRQVRCFVMMCCFLVSKSCFARFLPERLAIHCSAKNFEVVKIGAVRQEYFGFYEGS